MTEIVPTYYAEGVYKHRYTLKGRGFEIIPDDAVAVPSPYNDVPITNRYSDDPNVIMTIESRTPTEIVFAAANAVQHNAAYIGGILTADRETVIWENTTQPLP